jgi:hypothetical protein
MYTLSEIWVYPIKSLGGIALQEALVQPRGLQYDRRWMLADPETGRFVSQRDIPAMATLGTAIEPPHLQIFVKNNPSEHLLIPLDTPPDTPPRQVEVWGDRFEALPYPAPVNAWFSEQLGRPLLLAYMPDAADRPVDARYAPPGQQVSCADGYPYLVIGQATLDGLNNRLAEPLPINRFRPNFVFTGGTAHDEDHWADFSIGPVHFRGIKPCARCIIPTIDQDSGARANEPLTTLATYRKSDNKILFGQNVIWLGTPEQARVACGMQIKLGQ